MTDTENTFGYLGMGGGMAFPELSFFPPQGFGASNQPPPPLLGYQQPYPYGLFSYPLVTPLTPTAPSPIGPPKQNTTSTPQPVVVNTVVPQQQQIQSSVITAQPAPASEKLNDYLVWSILNCVFCNLFLGLIAIFFSCRAKDAFRAGNRSSGLKHRKVAKMLNVVSVYIGMIIIIAVLLATFAIKVYGY